MSNKPTINNYGDIVSFRGKEYRMRNGVFLERDQNGNLVVVPWRSLPSEVRDAFCERTF